MIKVKAGDTSRIIHGVTLFLVRIGVAYSIIDCALKKNKNPSVALKALRLLVKKRKEIHGNAGGHKAVHCGGRYYWSTNIPGWPSEGFNYFIGREIDRFSDPVSAGLQTIIFGITGKCPLNCNHCYESENLSGDNDLSAENLLFIMEKIFKSGIRHIQFSGGEPLSRFDDMLSLMDRCDCCTDLWINTSGYGLTIEKARKMKEKGMTGAIISLDHWDESWHNNFRNNIKSYYWVREAVRNCNEAGIIVSLSLCPVRDFVTYENLSRYHELSKDLGAAFIRIMEPREAGRFKGADVMLGRKHVDILESFVRERNTDRKFRNYPIIQFPGNHQRRLGCLGAGNRYIYIDPAGNFHSCPFCRNPLGNALTDGISHGISRAKESGCHIFKQQTLV
jgi:MoaA/NifB/PqqE/SkfB family radical SAM enzyme